VDCYDSVSSECLFKNDYFTLLCHEANYVVEVVRSRVGFPSAQDAAQAFAPLLLRLDDLGRQSYALLLDSRDATPNNDPAYEALYARFRNDLHRGFRKIAVLVRTSAGNLQATRLVPPVDAPVRVFQDREAAWVFVTTRVQSTAPSLVRGSDYPSRR
jgi:hypothetical protein